MSKVLYITDALASRGYVYDMLTDLVTKGHSCEETEVGYVKKDSQTDKLEHLLQTFKFDLVIIDRDCLPKKGVAVDIQKAYPSKIILFNFVETQDVFPRVPIINPLSYKREEFLKKIEEYLPKDQISSESEGKE